MTEQDLRTLMEAVGEVVKEFVADQLRPVQARLSALESAMGVLIKDQHERASEAARRVEGPPHD